MAVALSRFFRFGTPALALLSALAITPWWLVLLPVIPVWCSFCAGVQEAVENRRIIQRPGHRRMSVEERAAEQRFLYANAIYLDGSSRRNGALKALAAARAKGMAEAASLARPRRGRLARGLVGDTAADAARLVMPKRRSSPPEQRKGGPK